MRLLRLTFERFADNVTNKLTNLANEISNIEENKPYSIVVLESLIDEHKKAYMSNTGNLTPMDKYTFRWFRWIHRTNKSSVGETFFRWKINDVMTHGKQILVNSDCRTIYTCPRRTLKAKVLTNKSTKF